MVRIIDYKARLSDDQRVFYVLELQGGLEMIMSKTTGQFYATAKKASITSTFDEETCKALVGTEMEGSITKQECEPYEYTVKETGEVIMLSHRYVFTPKVEAVSKEDLAVQKLLAEEHTFSQNGVSKEEFAI